LDIRGPNSTPDLFDNRYVLGIVCYDTSTIVGVLTHHNSDALRGLADILASIASFGHKPSRIRIDNDFVFLNAAFTSICRSIAITIEHSMTYAHQQLARIEQ
jgi:hypothetical protein